MNKKIANIDELDLSEFFTGASCFGLDDFGLKRPSPSFEEVRVTTPEFWNQLKSGVIKKIVDDIIE